MISENGIEYRYRYLFRDPLQAQPRDPDVKALSIYGDCKIRRGERLLRDRHLPNEALRKH